MRIRLVGPNVLFFVCWCWPTSARGLAAAPFPSLRALQTRAPERRHLRPPRQRRDDRQGRGLLGAGRWAVVLAGTLRRAAPPHPFATTAALARRQSDVVAVAARVSDHLYLLSLCLVVRVRF